MNKTVSINLGGFFFHIDENAYQKLNRYFDAIKQSLSAEGRDEIMSDIENRISELFSEKLTSEKQVISILEVDQVISVMGQPEDYRIEGDEPKNTSYSYESTGKIGSKKLYRDTENGSLGGVASGLGHYFGVDKVWIRIIFVLLALASGTGILAYIILWAVTPEPKNTSEKLEMQGEPITISNIEKKVRSEFDHVSEKIKSVDYDKMGNQVKSSAQKISGTLSDVLGSIFMVFGKIIGVFMILISTVSLIALFISMFALGSTSNVKTPWMDHFNTFNYTNTSLFFIGMLFLFAFGIPLFFLLYLGLKILITNLRSIGNIAKYSLLAVWIASIIILVSLTVRQASEVAFDNKIINKKTINLDPKDTLYIKFKTDNYYTQVNNNNDDFMFVEDSLNNQMIYSNEISFEIKESDEPYAYLQIEKQANGKSFKDAKQRAEKIKYGYKFENNKLILDNYLLTDAKTKYRGQEIEIYLYLPKGIVFKVDKSVQDYDSSDNDFFNLHHSSDDYIYKVVNNKVKCLNCPADEDEWDDLENEIENDIENSEITINENGVQIKSDTVISNSKDIKELKINKDGIIIKTE